MRSRIPTSLGLYIDMGTTHTRVWFLKERSIIARTHARLGVQDAACAGSTDKLRAGLRNLLMQTRSEALQKGCREEPAFVMAAGMLTSSLGLEEIPHLSAPAGLNELAAAVQTRHFADVAELPFLLVPGVRTEHPDDPFAERADTMRGEETLCVGLAATGVLPHSSTLMNLGSHWKAIRLDEQGRIAGSITSLSGEMLHAAHRATILSDSLPQQWPSRLEPAWIDAGMAEQRVGGLPRALFCVRLLEQLRQTSPGQRFAFLCGAFIAADLDALAKKTLAPGTHVVLAGNSPLVDAWHHALRKVRISVRALSVSEVETGFLEGLRTIASHRTPH